MFADSLLDSAWPSRSRRGWSTLASFAAQVVALGGVLLMPLLYTSGLPQLRTNALVVAPSSAPPLAVHVQAANSPPRLSVNHQRANSMVAPRSVPRTIEAANDLAIPSFPDLNEVGASGRSNVRASGNGVDHGFDDFDVAAPPPPPPAARQLRVSRMMEGNLSYRVDPEYPALAKLARIQGAVVLHAVISKQGTIENLQPASGPPLLMKAAADAVRLWRYRPYYLNGEPVEVETQITVNFVLSGG